MNIRHMLIRDYSQVYELWERSSDDVYSFYGDKREYLERYLLQHPNCSFIVEEDDFIIGCVLCSCNFRIGFLEHLVIHGDYRRRGIGSRLVQRVIEELEKYNIPKCNILVYRDNDHAKLFWESLGFISRERALLMTNYK